MADDGLWTVRPVPRANGGRIESGKGLVVGIFGCELLVPNSLAKIIRDPFAEDDER